MVTYSYDSEGRIIGVVTESTTYNFTYNTANLPEAVYVSGSSTPLVKYLYDSKNIQNTGVVYANGLTISYEFDTIGNVRKVMENGVTVAEYDYDTNLNLIGVTEPDAVTVYYYDPSGALEYTSVTRDGHTVTTYSETDDETGDVSYITLIDGTAFTCKSTYDEETDISAYILPNLAEITGDEDDFGRTSHVYLKDSEGNNILTCTYAYVDKQIDGGMTTSDYISSMTYTNGKSYTYTYDAVGNITSVYDGTYTTSYVYDSLYELTRENNQKAGKTWTYRYDTAGNILSKSEYVYTTGELGTATDTVTYTYDSDWGDRLASYDGTAITYDAQGNPLTWRDDCEFTWSGRQLTSLYNPLWGTLTFTYNDEGIRTKKQWVFEDDSTETIEYILDDSGNVVMEKYVFEGDDLFWRNSSVEEIVLSDNITVITDEMFYNCTNLKSINLPANLKSLGANAFASCSALEKVTIPAGVTELCEGVFSECENLTEVTIEKGVEVIAENAFAGCRSLSNVYYSGTEAQWNEIQIHESNSALSGSVIIFNGVEYEIGDVNGDGSINALDAACVLKVIKGLTAAEDCSGECDLNGDGKYNALDSAMLLKIIKGIFVA